MIHELTGTGKLKWKPVIEGRTFGGVSEPYSTFMVERKWACWWLYRLDEKTGSYRLLLDFHRQTMPCYHVTNARELAEWYMCLVDPTYLTRFPDAPSSLFFTLSPDHFPPAEVRPGHEPEEPTILEFPSAG